VGRLRADLAALLANGPRKSGTPAETEAAEYFAAVAAEITGSAPELQPVPLPGDVESHNVWSAAVGTGDRLLLLGAHLDSVEGAPGGNDNGSGAVILLEILRRLVEDPPDGLRVVVVGFGAEERIGDSGHHFGSRHAVDELVAAGALPAFMISVDMVGVGNDLHVIDFDEADPTFADELAEAAIAAGFDIDRLSRGEISDHVAFARAGVPAAHIWRSQDPEYHTPGDDDFADAAVLESLALVEVLIDHLIPEAHELEGGDQDHI
jgi:Zn-dependent M28 family amino/carboxypeptidase